jgi:hypothetical protein
MNTGDVSRVQRPRRTSSGLRRKGLNRAPSETCFQKSSRRALAPSAPPSAWPSTRTAAFMAPADVPEMPSIRSHGSWSKRSSTPQVKAPCEPPPCKARSTRSGFCVDLDLGTVVMSLSTRRPGYGAGWLPVPPAAYAASTVPPATPVTMTMAMMSARPYGNSHPSLPNESVRSHKI